MQMVHFIPPSQRRLALMAAQADTAPALIFGGSGTGKGAIAKWIHATGPRSARVLLEASRKLPLTEQLKAAQTGTLVIHELGEWPLSEQRVLLEYLKTKSIPESTGLRMLLNVRIIGTTSQALDSRAQGGLFNAELLEKLNVFRIEMPPLSKRGDEFEDIVLGIMGEITRELHKEHLRALSPEAWALLKAYDWPGNLRELRNVLRVAIVAAVERLREQGNEDQIEKADFPDFGHEQIDFRATREQFERIYIMELLRTFDWEIDRTCTMARMDKATLLTKMNQYGIRGPETTVS